MKFATITYKDYYDNYHYVRVIADSINTVRGMIKCTDEYGNVGCLFRKYVIKIEVEE